MMKYKKRKEKRKHRDIGERDGAISLVIWHNKAKQQQQKTYQLGLKGI